jgi:thiamine-phosphate pyrophosphorylase
MAPNLAAALQLLLVTDDRLLGERDPLEVCERAVAGGVSAVQLRLKEANDAELLGLARRLVATLTVPVFVNDRFEVALAAGAHGVHLGPDDLHPEEAVRRAPAGFWVGASVGSLAEIARGASAAYWGIGPLHQTGTKHDAGSALGVEGARALLQHAGSRPCVVIGGVQPEDVLPARNAGFAGVAVSGGILGHADIVARARMYAEKIERLKD